MSSEQTPAQRPWVIPVIIFAADVVIFAVLGATGAIEHLSPAAQFYFGASTVAFPLIIYLFLKRRSDTDRT